MNEYKVKRYSISKNSEEGYSGVFESFIAIFL